MKAKEFLFHPKTVVSIVMTVLVGYGWMFTNFVNASDFRQHVQTYELDRTDDKIDILESWIFNLEESIRMAGTCTPDQRKQLSKYIGDLTDYRRQQECLEAGRDNCRRKR